MVEVLQGTVSPGFGGLELVIIEFHEWLIRKKVNAFVLTVEGTPLEKALLERGYRQSTITIPKNDLKMMRYWRKKFDAPGVAHLFHRHQGLRQLLFQRYQAKVSAMSHTFYDVKKRDLFHRYIFSKVDQWVALTPRHKENLLATTAIAEDKVSVIPNGVNLQKFKPVYKPLPPLDVPLQLGVIARLDRQKGQEIAIRALKKLIDQKNRKWTLHFFGEDTPSETPVRPILEEIATELGVRDQVIFEGFQENLGSKVQSLDVIWMPSYKETFGRCVIEGMASGIPVVASNAGGVPDIIRSGENGILFETKNPNDLADKTWQLVNNPQLFASIQKEAVVCGGGVRRDTH